ncbi:helix-turn-helix transcriptional regulator [uncultured Clostridium sp.]|uniref:helix-turn-helix domain-containing protein n=1 Tax=uncultured Clostridium sp. TaxID=59620 RepID=UPI0028EADD84|nr:helix-turn-helix transcriptional regulator [uncultured Clostridium sp.]
MDIGDLIKTKRIEKNISQDQLAQLIDTTQRSVSNWESSQNEPSAAYIPKLSTTLDIPLEDLTATPELYADFVCKKDNDIIRLIDVLYEVGLITSDSIDDDCTAVIIKLVKKYLKEKESRD